VKRIPNCTILVLQDRDMCVLFDGNLYHVIESLRSSNATICKEPYSAIIDLAKGGWRLGIKTRSDMLKDMLKDCYRSQSYGLEVFSDYTSITQN
jgi:hypothetical protein